MLKKRVELAYGRSGLCIDVPDHTQVVMPRHVNGVPEEATAILAALDTPTASPPLAELAAGKRRVVVTHSDITRATPNDRILPVLLQALESAGVARENITLINALGTHRPQTETELRQMLGAGVFDHYHCQQHNAWDDAELVTVGTTSSGNSIRLNRTVVNSDLVIFTGFIEPHFFAGFSGGPKGALPALAGSESVLTNHGYSMIGDPRATWGVTDGNPIWEEMREAARLIEPLFLLNVTLNTEGQITGVFAGDVVAAHRQGCGFVRDSAMMAVEKPFDVVVTTNSGYPLDQNLYQTVKGMQAARGIVRAGGAIIMAAECSDGVPSHGRYAELLAKTQSPEAALEMLRQPGFSAQDQWQVQIQAQIQSHAHVYVYSDGLSDDEIRNAHFTPTRSIETTLAELAPDRVRVLPQGPLSISYLDPANL